MKVKAKKVVLVDNGVPEGTKDLFYSLYRIRLTSPELSPEEKEDVFKEMLEEGERLKINIMDIPNDIFDAIDMADGENFEIQDNIKTELIKKERTYRKAHRANRLFRQRHGCSACRTGTDNIIRIY